MVRKHNVMSTIVLRVMWFSSSTGVSVVLTSSLGDIVFC